MEVAKCMKLLGKEKISLGKKKKKRLAALELYKGVYGYGKKFLKIALKKQILKLFIPIEKKGLQEMFLFMSHCYYLF